MRHRGFFCSLLQANIDTYVIFAKFKRVQIVNKKMFNRSRGENSIQLMKNSRQHGHTEVTEVLTV